MRLKLTLRQTAPVTLPMSTGYYISAAIYETLQAASPEYAHFLHQDGYHISHHELKKFKLFSFSNLQIPRFDIQRYNGQSYLHSTSSQVQLVISSPMETFLQHLVTGLFDNGLFRVATAVFEKDIIETLPDPTFTDTMDFTMLSPLMLSTVEERQPVAADTHSENKASRLRTHFLRYDDPRFEHLLLQNLLRKYEAVHGKPYPDEASLHIEFNPAYIRRREGKIEKLLVIKQGEPEETRIKAIECPFRLTAPPELIKVGYDCGFGEKCSTGMGMVKIDD
jgi:CRISPR-associated endoribonuclease Cas6